MRSLAVVVLLCVFGCSANGSNAGADAGMVTCGMEGQVLYGSEDVEEAELEGCDIFLGGMDFAYDWDLVDLRFMPPLRVVEIGISFLDNRALESFRGLERLEEVGAFTIRWTEVLDDLRALSSVRRVEGIFIIGGNQALTGLDGLGNLRSSGELQIYDNPRLESLDGLGSLERVRGDLTIEYNASLSQEEIDAFLSRVEVDGEIILDGP